MKVLFKTILIFIFLLPTTLFCTGNDLIAYVTSRAIPFQDLSDMEPLFQRASASRLVLMGEASHGTHEYYVWRDSISRRLIREYGFRFVAVEGDWASLYELNRYVKGLPGAASSAREVLQALDRWPLWMWGNDEVVAFAEWIRDFNQGKPIEKRVGFYGMDVYDEWRSKEMILSYLSEYNQTLYQKASSLLDCFLPFDKDSWTYARGLTQGYDDCSNAMEQLLDMIKSGRDKLENMSDDTYFSLVQHAMVARHAEQFYRKSATRANDASAWNSRVLHMHLTINRLSDKYGEDSRGIVWAHNTHVGDARFTDMHHFGQKNIGQLAREYHDPERVFLIGFTTHRGTVQAGMHWGGMRQVMRIPRAVNGSMEYVAYKTGIRQFLLVFDEEDRQHAAFISPIGHRAVGVVYNPQNDHRQYVGSIVPLRYDAFLFFRETRALYPLR